MHNVGDPVARRVFKDEIAMRLESASPTVVEYLWTERYLHNLTKEEVTSVIESPQSMKKLIIMFSLKKVPFL